MRTTRRYLGCCTRRSTSTTMVFSILALVTRPVRICRSCRVSTAVCCVGASVAIHPSLRFLGQFMGAEQRFYPRQIFPCFPQTLERFGLTGGELKPEPEDLLGQFFLLGFELVDARFPNFFNATRHS